MNFDELVATRKARRGDAPARPTEQERLDAHIDKVVAGLKPLRPDQRARLSALLGEDPRPGGQRLVDAVVAKAPPLSSEQRERLACILRPGYGERPESDRALVETSKPEIPAPVLTAAKQWRRRLDELLAELDLMPPLSDPEKAEIASAIYRGLPKSKP